MLVDISFHETQMAIFEHPARYKVLVCGRRFGKSRYVTYNLILKSLSFPGKVDPVSSEMVLGGLPNAVLARKVLWRPLYNLCTTTFKDCIEYINRSQMLIVPKGGKPPIQIVGTNDQNGDSLRGLRLYHASLDEYQDINPGVLDTVIFPALSDTRDSSLLITGTPKGKVNGLYHVYHRALADKEWQAWNMPTSANPYVPRAEIEKAQRTLTPRTFSQEFLATFEDFDNAVYTELSDGNLEYVTQDFKGYIWGVDFGEKHPAVTVFGVYVNEAGQECYQYVNGWENPTDSVVLWDTFLGILLKLKEKYNPAMVYCDPSRPASILELRKYLPSVAGYNPIEDGISQVHSLFYQKRLTLTPVVERVIPTSVDGLTLLSELRSYQRAVARDGSILPAIAPNQKDHMTDSLRYAIARKKPQ